MEVKKTKELDEMLNNPTKALITMAVPLVISFLIIEVNSFLDVSWCTGLGKECASAVSITSPIYLIIVGLGVGLGVGATASIAGELGKENYEKQNSLFVQSIIISILITLVSMVAIFVLIDPVLTMMGVFDVRKECHDFVEPLVFGAIPLVLNGVVAGVLRAEGAARKSTYVLIIAAFFHMILDPIFIYQLNLGLTGAAIANVIAMGVGAAYGLSQYISGKMVIKPNFHDFRLKIDEIKYILDVGVPRVTELIIIYSMSMIQRIFIIKCGGTDAAMYYNIPFNYILFADSFSMGIGAALVPICAAAMARKNANKAKLCFNASLKYVIISLSIFTGIMFFFAEYLIIPFTYSESMEQLRPEFVHVMKIYALLGPCMGILDVSSSMLQGMRKAKISLFNSLSRNILITIVFAWACTISLDTIYWSLVFCEYFGVVTMYLSARYYLSKAQQKNVGYVQ